jgi:hypothetical protein
MRKLALIAALCFATLALPSVAQAWKPYTHNYTGTQAYNDALDGNVTLGGRAYSIPAPVRQALADWPSYYNAGVVGPDGFPDLTMGQSEIHPVRTGAWLKYILDRAWAAQSDSSYSPAEQEQILAFGYGFLTHAAGDMWAHTLVNEFARGVFPGVGEIVTHQSDAEIAIRHLIVEGYIGNATPGFDNNEDRTTLPDGDVSDDSTPGVAYDAPIRWIYETLVRPDQPDAPSTNRGPLINFFWNLQANLQVQKARFDFDKNHSDCAIIDPDCYERPHTLTVHTILGDRHTTVTTQDCIGATIGCLASLIDAADDLIINNIGSAYLGAWVDDIQNGMEHWGEVGLASTRALFDPQTRRDVQNDECHVNGSETNLVRINCENGIGAVDTLFAEMEPYTNHHLLSMLGAPDFVGDINELLGVIGDALDEVLGPALNPLRLAAAELKDAAKELVKDLIQEAYGVDVDQLADFLMHPTHYLDIGDLTLTLPVVGSTTVHLFDSWVHPRLDSYMHLPADHHVDGAIGSALSDTVEFNPTDFAAVGDTITMAKLLLLSPSELNHALGDALVADGVIKNASSVQTYQGGANVMYTPLSGTEPWLQLIDGDHSWRQDGLPVFCDHDKPGTCALGIGPDRPTGALLRSTGESQKNAGNGLFPMWESCLLRPAFRDLFKDWEDNGAQFPDLGDATSGDPSDTTPPTTSSAASGTTYTSGGTTYVGGANTLTVTGHDNVFTDSAISLQGRVYKDGSSPPGYAAIANGGTLSIPSGGGDGTWFVDSRGSEACNGFPTVGARDAYVLDTTPPDITVSPDGTTFDTDDLSAIHFSATDAGSGVDTVTATFDGAAATDGQTLDMFFLAPGTHTIRVTAVDHLGNTSHKTAVFRVEATAASLISNVDRANSLGLITKAGIYNSLRTKLEQAQKKHQAGQHAVEANMLNAFANELGAQSGKAVDAVTAARFIAFARDLIARGG